MFKRGPTLSLYFLLLALTCWLYMLNWIAIMSFCTFSEIWCHEIAKNKEKGFVLILNRFRMPENIDTNRKLRSCWGILSGLIFNTSLFFSFKSDSAPVYKWLLAPWTGMLWYNSLHLHSYPSTYISDSKFCRGTLVGKWRSNNGMLKLHESVGCSLLQLVLDMCFEDDLWLFCYVSLSKCNYLKWHN